MPDFMIGAERHQRVGHVAFLGAAGLDILLRDLAEELERLVVVARDAVAFRIHAGELPGGADLAVLGGVAIGLDRLVLVAALVGREAELEHRPRAGFFSPRSCRRTPCRRTHSAPPAATSDDAATSAEEPANLTNSDIRIAMCFFRSARMGDRAIAGRTDRLRIFPDRARLIVGRARLPILCPRRQFLCRTASRRECPSTASIVMMSPSFNSPIGPPTAASGPTWPMQKPRVAPEKRPSVMRATLPPMPWP